MPGANSEMGGPDDEQSVEDCSGGASAPFCITYSPCGMGSSRPCAIPHRRSAKTYEDRNPTVVAWAIQSRCRGPSPLPDRPARSFNDGKSDEQRHENEARRDDQTIPGSARRLVAGGDLLPGEAPEEAADQSLEEDAEQEPLDRHRLRPSTRGEPSGRAARRRAPAAAPERGRRRTRQAHSVGGPAPSHEARRTRSPRRRSRAERARPSGAHGRSRGTPRARP
jgi:hypothetical protein